MSSLCHRIRQDGTSRYKQSCRCRTMGLPTARLINCGTATLERVSEGSIESTSCFSERRCIYRAARSATTLIREERRGNGMIPTLCLAGQRPASGILRSASRRPCLRVFQKRPSSCFRSSFPCSRARDAPRSLVMASEIRTDYAGYRLYILIGLFTPLQIACVAMRFYSRTLTARPYFADDWLVVASLLSQFVMAGSIIGN